MSDLRTLILEYGKAVYINATKPSDGNRDKVSDALNRISESETNGITKRMSNDEFVNYIFSFSKAGPIAQMVLVYAMQEYVTRVADGPPMLDDPEKPQFIEPSAWQSACKILKSEFEQKYGTQ